MTRTAAPPVRGSGSASARESPFTRTSSFSRRVRATSAAPWRSTRRGAAGSGRSPRKAIPRANARRTGKTNVQKIVSGCRLLSRDLARRRWPSALFIAVLSRGQGNVHVRKRRLPEREMREGGGPGPEEIQKRWNGDVRLPDGDEERAVLPPDRRDPGDLPDGLVLHVARRHLDLDDEICVEGGDQIAGGPHGECLSPVDDGDPVAESLRLLHVMGREQDGASPVLVGEDRGAEGKPRLGVEPRGRLVQDEQFRVPRQRAGKSKPLPLSAGEFARPGAGLLKKTHLPDDQEGVAAFRIEACEQRHHLRDREAFRETGLLQRDPDARAKRPVVLSPLLPEHLDLPGRGGLQPDQDLDGRRLSRAVGAEQAEILPRPDFEVQGVHCDDRVVMLDEAPQRDRRTPRRGGFLDRTHTGRFYTRPRRMPEWRGAGGRKLRGCRTGSGGERRTPPRRTRRSPRTARTSALRSAHR